MFRCWYCPERDAQICSWLAVGCPNTWATTSRTAQCNATQCTGFGEERWSLGTTTLYFEFLFLRGDENGCALPLANLVAIWVTSALQNLGRVGGEGLWFAG